MPKEFQKINKPYKKLKLTSFLLEIAATATNGLVSFAESFDYKKAHQRLTGREPYITTPGFLDRVSNRSISLTLNRLKNKGCLEKIIKNGKTYYRITEKGCSKIDKFLFDRQKWDGYWRIVVFDLPEKMRSKRKMLRIKLQRLGFKQLQKSVWVSPFEKIREVEIVLEEHNLFDYVWCFLSKSIENDEVIIERFLKTKETTT